MAANPEQTEGIEVELPRNEILVGDAKETLEKLPAESVDMAMTSPPYWGLRDYGVDGQLGLEETVEDYITELVRVLSEVKRVLKPTGTFYLNIDDTFRRKELQMTPERIAFAMKRDGWLLRNKIVWAKTNPMPESVKDRFSTKWEYVFLFTKQRQYYFDLDAVREPYADSSLQRVQQNNGNPTFNGTRDRGHPDGAETLDPTQFTHKLGKNPGDVWKLSTGEFPEAHFAVYPEHLCTKPIRAGCPPKTCAECGVPYERIVQEIERPELRDRDKPRITKSNDTEWNNNRGSWVGTPKERKTMGWDQQCDCEAEDTQPGIVLDPFTGAGTTCLVARKLGRDYIGIELNEEYAEMARQRITDEALQSRVTKF